MNRALLPVAAGAMGLAVKNAPFLVSQYSDECRSAIMRQLADSQIQRACGQGFNEWDFVIIIAAGGGALCVMFWDKIAEAGFKTFNERERK